MANKYAEISVTSLSYLADPEFNSGFNPDELQFFTSGPKAAYFSFDGVNNHGKVGVSSEPNIGIRLRSKNQKVWLKVASDSGTSDVRIIASTDV